MKTNPDQTFCRRAAARGRTVICLPAGAFLRFLNLFEASKVQIKQTTKQ